MLNKILCVLLGSQALFSTAMAFDSNGTINVVRPFSVARTRSFEQSRPQDVEQITLTKGVHHFEILTTSVYETSICIPPFCSAGTDVPVFELVLKSNKPDSLLSSAKYYAPVARVNFDEGKSGYSHNSVIWTAAQTSQSFNMIESSSEATKKSNYRSEQQECSVEAFCRDNGYGGCYSAMGQQTINEHDEITTTTTIVRFTDTNNSLLATFTGTDDSSETVTDSAGKCVLNLP